MTDDRQEETCLPGHSTSETDSRGDWEGAQVLGVGPLGTLDAL